MQTNLGMYIIAILAVLWTVSVCAQERTSKAGTDTKSTAPSSEGKIDANGRLSPEFKKQVWRALDAFNRISSVLNRSEMDANSEVLINEASKAIDEAKYLASTSLDNYVLHSLQMALLSRQSQAAYEIVSPNWTVANHRALQCKLEVTYFITPDQLSEKGTADAKRLTCNEKTAEWSSGITR